MELKKNQESIEFIKQLDGFNLHKVLDEDGNEIEVIFEDGSLPNH
jgi:hypothetical protein